MGTIYITCPQTQKPVNTGVQMTAEAFQSWAFVGASTPCSHCGETHTYTAADARLEPQQAS
jgi:hypothetical protein